MQNDRSSESRKGASTSGQKKRWGVLLIVHGSPDERGNVHALKTFESLRNLFDEDFPIEIGFIEHALPEVNVSLARLVPHSEGVALVPVLLFDAGHSKSDMAEYAEQAQRDHPGLHLIRDWAFGTDQTVVSVLLDLLPPRDPQVRETLIMIGRGSLDPNANASLFYQGRRLWERRKGNLPHFSFISVTEPRLSDVLEQLDPKAQDRIVLLPYFLFEGVLMDRIRALGESYRLRTGFRGEVIVTPPFGDHPLLLNHLAKRIRRLLKLGRTPLPKWPILNLEGESVSDAIPGKERSIDDNAD
ncbi:MAG: sirohydrochlorin chelatase [Leptospirales bacterium]